jgi:HTH-type transcriptional regulator/antitoxin HigA
MATQLAPPNYLKLIRRCPLRPIRSDEDLDRAIEMIDALGSRIKDLTPDEHDYLDVLADLVEKYETARYPEPDVDPLAMIRELIAARGITQADVARKTGIAESMLSEILKGKRSMGRKTIETLSRFFHVDPGVFFPEGKWATDLTVNEVARKGAPSLLSLGKKAACAVSLPQPRGNAGMGLKDIKVAARKVTKKLSKDRKD